MASTPQTPDVPDVELVPTSEATCGRMVIELIPNGTARPIPRVSFDPVGMFTPGLVGDYLTHFAQEIAKAQAKVRHELRVKQKESVQ